MLGIHDELGFLHQRAGRLLHTFPRRTELERTDRCRNSSWALLSQTPKNVDKITNLLTTSVGFLSEYVSMIPASL